MLKAIDVITSGQMWAILPQKLETIISIASRENDIEAVQAKLGEPLRNTRTVEVREGVAIIPVEGPIFPKANLFTQISGATSIDILARDFNEALENPEIKGIILNFDTPGGAVAGVNELNDMIFEARGMKPIVSYVNDIGASAGFWLASAADEVVINDTAEVGSVGVVAALRISDDKDEIEIVSSQSPLKRADARSDEGRAAIQSRIDQIADVFITRLARNFNIDKDTVLSDFGRGDMLVGANAVASGMAHRLGNLESLIAGLSGGHRSIFAMPNTLTAKSIQESHPDIYREIRNDGYEDGYLKGAEDEEVKLKAQLKAKESEIKKAFSDGFAEGAETERERIKAVEGQALPGHEALIATLKFDGKTTGEKAAIQVLAAERSKGASVLRSIKSSAPEPIAPQPEADDNLPLEDRCQQMWNGDKNLRAEFSDKFDVYLAFKRNEERGNIKRLGT